MEWICLAIGGDPSCRRDWLATCCYSPFFRWPSSTQLQQKHYAFVEFLHRLMIPVHCHLIDHGMEQGSFLPAFLFCGSETLIDVSSLNRLYFQIDPIVYFHLFFLTLQLFWTLSYGGYERSSHDY